MAVERLRLVPAQSSDGRFVSYDINFDGAQYVTGEVRFRSGVTRINEPVVQKIAVTGGAPVDLLRREHEVGAWLGRQGGDVISKVVGHDLTADPPFIVTTYRGRSLAELVRDEEDWPLDAEPAHKVILDLLEALDILRTYKVVHRGLGMDTVRWDGTTLQLADFGQAAMEDPAADGPGARHADDVRDAGLIIFEVYTGEPPPGDPAELRRRLAEVHEATLHRLLIRHDALTGRITSDVFAADPALRPSARELLDRWTERPRTARRVDYTEREGRIRTEFGDLRARQRRFQARHAAWLARPRPEPPRPARGRVRPAPLPPEPVTPQDRPRSTVAVIGLAVLLLVVALLMLGVL